VTVFGGSGFVGRHVVRALCQAGWRVRVAVRRPHVANYLRPMGRVGQIQIVKANVLNDSDVASALTGADAVVNLVGILSQGGYQTFPSVHSEAAKRIAKAATLRGIPRLIHFSAIGASADASARYFRTKAQGEHHVRAEFEGVTIFRPAIVFGPEDNFFNRFAWMARYSPVLPLFGGGATRFQPVFVGDVAQAVTRALDDAGSAGKIYDLAGPEVFTFKELMEVILRITRRKRLLLPLPLWIAKAKGVVLGLLPNPLLTLDQARMLETNTVAAENPGLSSFGIVPDSVEAIVPSYLWRFRKTGQFESASAS
jgi:uncharacterized protein YbjT (DUF2867 family)